jgi:hypothetical protein
LTIEAQDNALPPNVTTLGRPFFVVSPGTDVDFDHLADDWEIAFGLDIFDGVGISGADGDFESDGFVNMLERALGMDPSISDRANAPKYSLEKDAGTGFTHLVVRYRRLISPGVFEYTIEGSSDALSWIPATSLFEEAGTPVPSGDGFTESVTFRLKRHIADPLNAIRYARVRVTISPVPVP